MNDLCITTADLIGLAVDTARRDYPNSIVTFIDKCRDRSWIVYLRDQRTNQRHSFHFDQRRPGHNPVKLRVVENHGASSLLDRLA